jgi:hypothetical protein
MNETLTVRQVLEITVNNLRGIMIPVELADTVGGAIVGSIRNLDMCIKAMDEAENGGATDGTEPDPE